MGLPPAYFVAPLSPTLGRLSVTLDLESQRMGMLDGLCSLRLREPCEWQGAMFEAVGPVQPVSVLSVLSANETADADAAVAEATRAALQAAEEQAQVYGDGNYTDSRTGQTVVDAGQVDWLPLVEVPPPADELPPARRRLLGALAGRLQRIVAEAGRKLMQASPSPSPLLSPSPSPGEWQAAREVL